VADETTPALRVTRGAPTPEEVAALVGALYARRVVAGPASGTARGASRWRASAMPAVPLRAGAGAWRASGLPA
jgi:hypothetical protein